MLLATCGGAVWDMLVIRFWKVNEGAFLPFTCFFVKSDSFVCWFSTVINTHARITKTSDMSDVRARGLPVRVRFRLPCRFRPLLTFYKYTLNPDRPHQPSASPYDPLLSCLLVPLQSKIKLSWILHPRGRAAGGVARPRPPAESTAGGRNSFISRVCGPWLSVAGVTSSEVTRAHTPAPLPQTIAPNGADAPRVPIGGDGVAAWLPSPHSWLRRNSLSPTVRPLQAAGRAGPSERRGSVVPLPPLQFMIPLPP
jgi:hypothetical protein